MIFVGIDISSKDFVVHAIKDNKKVVINGVSYSPTREGLRKMLKDLGKQKKLIVIEAGNQLKWIALFLKKRKDVELHVVHPNELKWITQSGKKTDKADAKKMAELARIDGLPRKVHVVEGSIRDLRELLSARENLMKKRVALINSIRGALKQEGVSLPAKFFSTKEWKTKLESTKLGKTQKVIITSYMHALEQMKVAEDDILAEIQKIKDPRLELLESIPAIGPITSRILLSGLDNAERFDNKKSVAKYGALTPRVYQSGNKKTIGKISNDGRKEMRRCLLQCAHTINRMKKNQSAKPLYEFSQRIAVKRNKKIAAVATARKLLTVAYGVLKNGEFYDPSQLIPNAA